MKAKSDSASQSLRALIAATLLIIMVLNVAVLVPVSPVLAESEEQTCPTWTWPTSLPAASHYVTVSIVDEEILLQIEPLPPPPSEIDCASCSEEFGWGTQTANAQVMVSELWGYSELTDEASRRAKLISMETTTEEQSRQSYTLTSSVEHEQYIFSLVTILTPLDSETYSGSFTMIDYRPAGESETTSLEFVELTSTFTLSQEYKVLGEVAKQLGKLYEHSGDETLAPLAEGYYNIREETRYLSKLVKTQLKEYDRTILESSAVLSDQDIWGCLAAIISCLLSIAQMPSILSACFLCVQVYTCIPACLSIFGIWWCVICLGTGIFGCLSCAYLIVGFPYECWTAGHCLGMW